MPSAADHPPDARDRPAGAPAARRRAPSASSSTTTRCTPSSTCRSKRPSSAPPSGSGANRSWPNRAIATSWRRAAFSRGMWRRCSTNSSAPGGASDVAGVGSRLELWRAVVLHGIPAATGQELSWILEETPALSRFRTDLPANARSASAALSELDDRGSEERRAVHRLWNARASSAVGRGRAAAAADTRPSRSASRLAAGGVRSRHRCLDPSAADSIPGWLSRSGPRTLVHARAEPRHSRLLPGNLPHVAGGTVRRLGANAPASGRRRPRCRAERARLDRTLPRRAWCRR